MGGDWQDLLQSVFIGLIFSFLVSKLISTVISFRNENLKLVHQDHFQTLEESENLQDSLPRVSEDEGELVGGESTEEDDDWEGMESTDLDEVFGAAAAFVAATAADKNSAMVSTELQLQLYGFYKIATEGPCSQPQPSALKVSARAKWNAWQKLGAMPPEEAMQKYITTVTQVYPSWADGLGHKNKDEGSGHTGNTSKGPMGPVFSSLIYEEESDSDLKLAAIHDCAREGQTDNLLKHIENGIPLNLRDSEGRTPLHWAVDRGHSDVVELLLNRNADVNAKDNEGQTPLHYAALCEREAIAQLLLKHNADSDIKDDEGKSPRDHFSSSWAFPISAK